MKSKILLLLIPVVVAFCSPTWSQEKITLPTPVYTDPGATDFRVNQVYINRMEGVVQFEVREVDLSSVPKPTGKFFTHRYDSSTTPTAAAVMSQINTGNFSVTSLEKRIIQRGQAEGWIPSGTISGTPQ